MKLGKILLTTDLSAESMRAFRPAAELARQYGAKLVLLHVVEDLPVTPHGAPLAPPMHTPGLPEEMEAARKRLEEESRLIEDGIAVEQDVISASNVSQAIADYAKEHDVDLVAMSTHGRSGFRRMVMGSVAEALLRHVHVPVLCFPRQE